MVPDPFRLPAGKDEALIIALDVNVVPAYNVHLAWDSSNQFMMQLRQRIATLQEYNFNYEFPRSLVVTPGFSRAAFDDRGFDALYDVDFNSYRTFNGWYILYFSSDTGDSMEFLNIVRETWHDCIEDWTAIDSTRMYIVLKEASDVVLNMDRMTWT